MIGYPTSKRAAAADPVLLWAPVVWLESDAFTSKGKLRAVLFCESSAYDPGTVAINGRIDSIKPHERPRHINFDDSVLTGISPFGEVPDSATRH